MQSANWGMTPQANNHAGASAKMPLLSRRCAAEKSSLRSLNALPSKAFRAFDPTRGGLPPPRAPPPILGRIRLNRGFSTSRADTHIKCGCLLFIYNEIKRKEVHEEWERRKSHVESGAKWEIRRLLLGETAYSGKASDMGQNCRSHADRKDRRLKEIFCGNFPHILPAKSVL